MQNTKYVFTFEVGLSFIKPLEQLNSDKTYSLTNNYYDTMSIYTNFVNNQTHDNGKYCGYWNENFKNLTQKTEFEPGTESIKVIFNTNEAYRNVCFTGYYRNLVWDGEVRIKGLCYFEKTRDKDTAFWEEPFHYFSANVDIDSPDEINNINNPGINISDPGKERLIAIHTIRIQNYVPNQYLNSYNNLQYLDYLLQSNSLTNSDIASMDITIKDEDGRYYRIGVRNNQIVSYQKDLWGLSNPVEENGWSYQVIPGFNKYDSSNINWTNNKIIREFGLHNSYYIFDGDISGSNSGLKIENFSIQATNGDKPPCIMPYTWIYDADMVKNITYTNPIDSSTNVYSGHNLRELMEQLPYPFLHNPATPIIFPNINRVCSWHFDLSLKTKLRDVCYGNRFDLSLDGYSFDPGYKHCYTSKAFMNQRNTGDTNYLLPVSRVKNNSGDLYYDMEYSNTNLKKYRFS
jgi:hypothetical protein